MLTTHFHLVPRLRMSGAICLIPLYVFMVCTATPLPYIIREDEKVGSRDRLNTGNNF